MSQAQRAHWQHLQRVREAQEAVRNAAERRAVTDAVRAYRPDGTEVRPGDVLTSFRSSSATFVSARQSRVSGKVTVRFANRDTAEHYPRVWGLHEPIGTKPGAYNG